MSTPDVQAMSSLVRTAVRSWDANRPRSIQGRSGKIGFSSLGFCHQYALLTMQEVPATDADRVWPAVVGSAVGDVVEKALSWVKPTWPTQVPLTATFSNGASLTGHADLVVPDDNVVWDVKSKDGLAKARRNPWSLNYDYQTWGYVLAGIQSGLLDKDRPAWQGLIYVDRSGEEDTPFCVVKQWLPTKEAEIVAWIDDVIYAHLHGEDAARDIPAAVCEQICELYTACRGALEDTRSQGVYDDPYVVDAVRDYVQAGREMRDAINLRDDARKRLVGVEGISDGYQVRWTHVEPTTVDAFTKAGHDRIDVRKARAR